MISFSEDPCSRMAADQSGRGDVFPSEPSSSIDRRDLLLYPDRVIDTESFGNVASSSLIEFLLENVDSKIEEVLRRTTSKVISKRFQEGNILPARVQRSLDGIPDFMTKIKMGRRGIWVANSALQGLLYRQPDGLTY